MIHFARAERFASLAVAVLLLAAVPVLASESVFLAGIDGSEEVPPTPVPNTGYASLFLNEAQTQVSYFIEYEPFANETAAHFHMAAPGVNGPVIFPLPARLRRRSASGTSRRPTWRPCSPATSTSTSTPRTTPAAPSAATSSSARCPSRPRPEQRQGAVPLVASIVGRSRARRHWRRARFVCGAGRGVSARTRSMSRVSVVVGHDPDVVVAVCARRAGRSVSAGA